MKIQNAFRFGLFGGLGVLLAIAIGAAITSLATILTYVGAAIFLALGLDPFVTWLEKKGMKRPFAIVIVLSGVLAVVAGLVLAIIPVIADQVDTLVRAIPPLVASIEDNSLIEDIQRNFPWLDTQTVLDEVSTAVQQPTFIGSLGGGVLQAGITIATGLTGALIVTILVLYFIASLASLKRGLYELVPASKRERFIDLSEQISDSVGRYVVGQGTLAFVNGVLSFIVLTFVFQVQYSALLAFIAFLGSLIPLVGTITASIVITLGVLLFDGPPTVFWVAGYYLVYMQVEAYVLNPRIMTRAVQVPGVVVVVAALAGGTLLGILGALVAIPVAASIQIVVRQVVVPRQNEL
ncbi:AI-2E family transporter [Marisediminicola senii]|uniref:AI-2E family transporter n=1 Tax=Marisediminicola senii TaxID=2711233 RepID=UPI0013EBE420|nr:AI-2E family transporter [Marisediminicola senii]